MNYSLGRPQQNGGLPTQNKVKRQPSAFSNHKSRFSSSALPSHFFQNGSQNGRESSSSRLNPPGIKRRALSASTSISNTTFTANHNCRGGLNGVVDKHADMRNFLGHRQRVMEVKSRIVSSDAPVRKRARSTPAPQSGNTTGGGGYLELERRRQLQLGNQRLLRKLVQISCRKTQFGLSTSANPLRNLQ